MLEPFANANFGDRSKSRYELGDGPRNEGRETPGGKPRTDVVGRENACWARPTLRNRKDKPAYETKETPWKK
jgi:hypothetical protein